MINILSALLGGLAGAQPPQDDTEVEGITVMPRKKVLPPPPPPARNPFTPDYIAAAQQAAASQAQLPRISGGTDAGAYGFLPQKMQTGRLRDILGAIGDGLLIGSKADPIYAPRKEARQMGQALLGYDQDPNAAIERLAQTGAPDSIKTASGLLQGIQTSEDKAAQRELTAAYHQSMNRARTDQILQRAAGVVPGVLARAKTADDYASAYQRLDAMAKRIDPDATPETAWGLPSPEDWTPDQTAWIGTTGGQQIGADVRRESIAQRREATGLSHADRQASIAQRASSAGMSHQDRQAAIAQRREAAASRPSRGARTSPGNKPSAGGSKPLPQSSLDAYNRGSPAQRAAARKAWASQGFDTSKLK